MNEDKDCICKGNWRLIVAECEHLLDQRFVDERGDEFIFYGIVHGSDDYYYGMAGVSGHRLLSCVGSLETYGFQLIEEGDRTELDLARELLNRTADWITTDCPEREQLRLDIINWFKRGNQYV